MFPPLKSPDTTTTTTSSNGRAQLRSSSAVVFAHRIQSRWPLNALLALALLVHWQVANLRVLATELALAVLLAPLLMSYTLHLLSSVDDRLELVAYACTIARIVLDFGGCRPN